MDKCSKCGEAKVSVSARAWFNYALLCDECGQIVIQYEACDNCGAKVPECGRMFDGRKICCAHCAFNPEGCRCKYGEFGVEETFRDPDEPLYDLR